MISQEFLLCVRETAFRLIISPFSAIKQSEACFLNPPCGCGNPGQELQCEDCPHLEAYVTRCQNVKSDKRNLPLRQQAVTIHQI